MSGAPRGLAKWLLRGVGALVFLCLALVLVTALLLPSLLSGQSATRWIRDAAREATGSELEWAALDVAFFPPALAIEGVRARAEEMGPEPWLSATRVELRLAWLPLLARVVLIDSLAVDELSLALRRNREGWVLPVAPAGAGEGAPSVDPPGDPGARGDGAEEGSGSAAMQFAVRSFEIRNGVLRLEDHSGRHPHSIVIADIAGQLVAHSPTEPVELSLRGALGGGAIDLDGALSLERDLALELRFRDVAMETVQPYLEGSLALAGRASGVAQLRGSQAGLDEVDLVLASDDAAIASEELSASGPLEIELRLEDLATPTGVFRLDATRAVLVYEVVFRKPAGVQATAGGRFRTRADGSIDIDFDEVKIKDLGARGELRGGATPVFSFSTEPFSLEGWGELVPPLAEIEGLGGQLRVPELEVTLPDADASPRLRGRVALDRVHFAVGEDAERLTLHGEVAATGDALVGEALTATFRGQELPVTLRVDEIFDTPRASLQSALEEVDANAFVSALTATPDTLLGTLSLDANLAAPLGAEALLDALRGRVTLRVEPGRLRGISLLRSAFDALAPLSDAAILTGQAHGGSTLQRFYDDEFRVLSGTFDVAGGRARTEDLRLLYRNYQIDLQGVVGLAEGDLDLQGAMTFFEKADPDAAPGIAPGVRRVLPLAGVRGSVGRPRVVITPDAALAWVTALGRGSENADGDPSKSRLEEKIDERLGEGTGREIFNALEGLLGNGRR